MEPGADAQRVLVRGEVVIPEELADTAEVWHALGV